MHYTGSNPIALLMLFGPDPSASRTILDRHWILCFAGGESDRIGTTSLNKYYSNRPYELAADSNALTMQFELGANSWLMDRITSAGFRDSGPLGGQLLQTRIRARNTIPDPISGFDRFGLRLRLQFDYSRLNRDWSTTISNRFSKIGTGRWLFLRARPRSDGHGHGNFEFFSF